MRYHFRFHDNATCDDHFVACFARCFAKCLVDCVVSAGSDPMCCKQTSSMPIAHHIRHVSEMRWSASVPCHGNTSVLGLLGGDRLQVQNWVRSP